MFEEGELDEQVVVLKFRTTTQNGAMAGKTQQSEVKSYNLDVIISVYLSSKKKLSGIKYTLQHFGNRHKRIKRPCSKVGVRFKVAPRLIRISHPFNWFNLNNCF